MSTTCVPKQKVNEKERKTKNWWT